MGRVSTCQKNCNTIDLRGAQVNELTHWGWDKMAAILADNIYKCIF